MKVLYRLIVFFSLLGVFLLVFSIYVGPEKKQLKLCRPVEVSGLSFVSPEGVLTAGFDQSTATWWVESGGLKAAADDRVVASLLTIVCYLPYQEKFALFESSSTDPGRAYGLATPSHRVLVRAAVNFDLNFGDPVLDGTGYYVLVSSDPDKVYVVSNRFRQDLFPDFMDLRNRRPLGELPRQKAVTIGFGAFKLRLEKTEAGWREAKGLITRKQARDLIELLASVRFVNYFKFVDNDMRQIYDLDFPDVTLEWEGKAGIKTSQIHFNNGRYYLLFPFNQGEYLLILSHAAPHDLFERLKAIAKGLAMK